MRGYSSITHIHPKGIIDGDICILTLDRHRFLNNFYFVWRLALEDYLRCAVAVVDQTQERFLGFARNDRGVILSLP